MGMMFTPVASLHWLAPANREREIGGRFNLIVVPGGRIYTHISVIAGGRADQLGQLGPGVRRLAVLLIGCESLRLRLRGLVT